MRIFDSKPLKLFSSTHKISILSLMGINTVKGPKIEFTLDFNIQDLDQKSYSPLTFRLRDASTQLTQGSYDLSICNLNRWILNVAEYNSFNDFIEQKLNHRQRKKYEQTQERFSKYGATLTLIDGDWSQYAEKVYPLYLNIAKKHGTQLYDLNFFREIATKAEYKLMCAWYRESLFAIAVLIDEEPTLHSMIGGLDYKHSKKTHAYTLMHYEMVRLAIESKKYSLLNIGITSGKAKSMMGFGSIPYCMDISSRSYLIKFILRMISFLGIELLNEEGKLQLKWSLFNKNSKS